MYCLTPKQIMKKIITYEDVIEDKKNGSLKYEFTRDQTTKQVREWINYRKEFFRFYTIVDRTKEECLKLGVVMRDDDFMRILQKKLIVGRMASRGVEAIPGRSPDFKINKKIFNIYYERGW